MLNTRKVLGRGKPGTPDSYHIDFYGTVKRVGDELRMWYPASPGKGVGHRVCYAVSKDGINWEKPSLGLVEYAGNHPAERFNHVHLYQEDPIGAFHWYQKHLNAPVRPGYAPTAAEGNLARGPDRTWPALNREGMFRTPRAGVEFGDVSMMWYANQGDRPLASSRGQLQDHIALSVGDLDAWIDKLRGEGVKFLEEPYRLGDTRAIMIEGPSREAIELVEVK